MQQKTDRRTLDPVTFEVLKNAYVNIVDQMAEQILRTCYSFVIYSRDFSSALCDPNGDTIMQGSGDIAAHVGTLHLTAKAVIKKFKDDVHPGDVFVINDVYQGGTHFNDTRLFAPMFYKGELLGFAQANGHWADVGGAVPGSFNVNALDHMAEGLRITPIRVYSKGTYLSDVAELIAHNTRAPNDIIGDLQAQSEACRLAEREIQRLCDKYGVDVIKKSFAEVQDYVEDMTRQRISELPNGTWETIDYEDVDPDGDEGLDDDRRGSGPLRSHGVAPQDGRFLPELLLWRRFCGRGCGNEDAVARYPDELGILPGCDGRSGTARFGGQCGMAHAGRGLCIWTV